MNIEITIGGYSAPWRLLGAGSTIRWFAKQPWFNFQEPIVIHIPGQHQEEVFDLLRCEVRRVAEGDVHIVCLQPLENAWGTFTKWLDTSATTPRKLAEALAECARFCPRLFVIEPVADATIWMDDLSLLLDITQKLPDAVPFGIILTAAGSMPPPLSVPLGAGWPEFHHQDRDERIAWAAYLHERVAWHAAGSIDRVDSLSHRIGAISVGADRDLETALGLDADEAFAVLGGPVRNDLLTSTRTLSGHSRAPQGWRR
jgi:hypothetical protein